MLPTSASPLLAGEADAVAGVLSLQSYQHKRCCKLSGNRLGLLPASAIA